MNLTLKAKCGLSLIIGLGLSLWFGVSLAQAQCPNDLCYVDASVTLTMTDGMRWTTAYTNLQDALAVAQAGDEIWVAAGVYYPDEGGGQTDNDVTASFALKDGVEIYGGFAATETSRSQRQPKTNVTVLSGDIDGNDGTDSNEVVTTTANISGTNARHVIFNSDVNSTAVLDGFTITAGDVDVTGVCPDNNNCGGGMYNIRSSPEMSQISFRGNRAGAHGGGMVNWDNSHPKMSQISFSGNTATHHGGGMINSHSSHPEMSQVSFSGNAAAVGGGMFNQNSSNPKMSQVSFSGNRAVQHGGGMYNTGSSPHIINSIFWGNAASGLMNARAQITNSGTSSPVISYTLIQSSGGSSAWDNNLGSNGGHNLDADPLFREPIDPALAPTSIGNLRLKIGSPAIDVGDNSAARDEVDLDGATRIQGRGVDLGAYERAAPYISLSKAVSPVGVDSGQRVTYTLVLRNSGLVSDSVRLSDTLPSGVEFAAWVAQGGAMITANEIRWQGPVTAGESISITFGVTNLISGGVFITNTAQFSSSFQTGSTSVRHVVLSSRRLYVDADVTLLTATDGMSWTSAYTNLQDALAVAVAGDEIWVAEGVYYPDEGRGQTNNVVTASFALKDWVEIYGGFAGTETQRRQRQPRVNVTVLSGDIDRNDGTDSHGVVTATANITGSNAYHVIYNSGVTSTAVLDGFTITAGDADDGGGICPNDCGGGMYNIRSSPEINQISFRGNRAGDQGGGMFNDRSNPKMSQISFSGNSSDFNGGGMYNDSSSPVMSQVTFSGNSSDFNGGGMVNQNNSNPKMSQVSFSGNSANFGGGMVNWNGSSPEMSQVSFSGNSATNFGGGMYNDGSSNPHIVNSIFWGNAASGLMNAPAQILNTSASTPTISYTLVQSSGGSSAWDNNLGSNGGNNLDADPRFREPIDPADAPTSAGNLRLRAGSPAIDVGDDRAASGPLDLEGAPRIQGRRVDLGAYEAPGPIVSLSKAVSPVRVEPDQRVTYTLVLSNSGLVSDSVRLSDTLPSGVEFAAWGARGGGGGVITANEISWHGPVTAGESITITFAGTNRRLSGGIIITNTAQFSGSLHTGSSSVSHTVLNVSPLAADDTYSTTEDTRLTIISPTGVLSNDGDLNGDMLTATVQSDVSSGTLDLKVDGSFVYTPPADVDGQDYFSYQVSDGVLSDTALVTITIAAVNDAPVAFDDTARANEDEAVSISVLSNDVDVDNSRLSLTAVSPAQNGRSSISGQQVVYSPSLNFAGTDSFTYRVSDGSLSDTASVTVTVNAVNDAPVAEAGADQSVRVSQSVTLDGSGSSDVEGDALGYGWQQTGGPRVTLNRPTLSRTTFIVPALPTVLTFSLSVTDEQGLASSSSQVVITVTEEAIAGLRAQNSSPAALNEVIIFTASITAGTNVSYTWHFGDGGRAVGQIVTYFYVQTGTYTATVEASNSTNSLTATTRVTITSIPEPSDEAIAGLTVQNSPVMLNEVITFTAHITAGTNVSYTWHFGDGEQVSGTSEVNHVYTQAGTYTATVVASNSTNTLTATIRVTITSIPEPSDEAIAGLTVQNSPVMLNEVITFTAHITAGTNVSYTWHFGDGEQVSGTSEVSRVYTQAGTYTATVVASNSINTLTATIRVTITDEAIAGLTVQNSPVTLNEVITFTAHITAGTNVSYTWHFGDGEQVSGTSEVSRVYTQAGTYTATVVASNSTNTLTATTVVSIPPMIESPRIDVTDYLSPDLRLRHFTAYQGRVYSYTVRVSPSLMRAQALHLPATQVYTLTAPTKPAWLDFVDHRNNTGTLMGMPGAADRGEQAVTILATDGQVSSTAVFTITVGPNQVYLPLVFK